MAKLTGSKTSGKLSVIYHCQQCDYQSASMLGRCPECGAWGSLEPESFVSNQSAQTTLGQLSLPQDLLLPDITTGTTVRIDTGIAELNTVLGGGLVAGSYILLGGDPGIGKSTLSLQWAAAMAAAGHSVVYLTGEESPEQVKHRAQRMGLDEAPIRILPETNLALCLQWLDATSDKPTLLVVDSIQSLYHADHGGIAGSVSQLKACATMLMSVAKTRHIAVLLIGHVTKEGEVAGPKLLEHLVDTVLYLEGEKYQQLRLLRVHKNRFGNTQELGLFDMQETGLHAVDNPSSLFLSESSFQNTPGSMIVATMEGSRPLLVELQALVGTSAYGMPRRVTNGLDVSRLHQLLAVLEKRLGLDFSRLDVYVNVAGGLRLAEPATDLGVAMALVSALWQVSPKVRTVVMGEIGLTGELRTVRQVEKRVAEAARMGFEQAVVPTLPVKTKLKTEGLQLTQASNLVDAITRVFPPQKS